MEEIKNDEKMAADEAVNDTQRYTERITLRLSKENYDALNELGVFKDRTFTQLTNQLLSAYVKSGSVTTTAQNNFADIVNDAMRVQLGQMQKSLQTTLNALYRIAAFDMRLLSQSPENARAINFAKKKSWQDYTEMLMGQKFPRDLGSDFSSNLENDEDDDFPENEDFRKTKNSPKPEISALHDFQKRTEIQNVEKPIDVNFADRMPDNAADDLGESDEDENSEIAESGENDDPAFSSELPESEKPDEAENLNSGDEEKNADSDDSEVYDGYHDGDFCEETGKRINLHAYDTGLPSSKYHVRPEDEAYIKANPWAASIANTMYATREQVASMIMDANRAAFSVKGTNFLTPHQEEKMKQMKIPHKPTEPWDEVIAQIEEAEKSD